MASAAVDVFDRPEWVGAAVSVLGRHGACCDRARAWLAAMGRSHDFAATDGLAFAGPGWLTERYAWGPTRWPLAWCDAVRAPTIDCGVFSAFALEIFRAKGIEAFPGQVLRFCAAERTTHWRSKWSSLPEAFNWIGSGVVYHEVNVVRVSETDARVYDPTVGVWLDAGVKAGHGAHIAIRAELPVALSWEGHKLVGGQWTKLVAVA
ncbi:hypothetical protein [Mycobacterium sp. 94-17]|uniref:hypothetical protein n=1 Tax=Mycobacterium sp. 94-17 TaxID=2986147 RepID=UPI002D1EDBB1|nr:hypothetical protein [Mycobacterium sp. 94-17]MEB4207728.1 hypothetical protein [Mycobacterium sp. 94-17]